MMMMKVIVVVKPATQVVHRRVQAPVNAFHQIVSLAWKKLLLHQNPTQLDLFRAYKAQNLSLMGHLLTKPQKYL
jgi:hypothetical protein